MNGGVERSCEVGFFRSGRLIEIEAKKFAKLLAAINRLAVGRGAIDHCRQRLDELPEETLALEHCGLCTLLFLDLDCNAVPGDNYAVSIMLRPA